MTEIQLGQEWREKKYAQRLMRVEELKLDQKGSLTQVKLLLLEGQGRPSTFIQPYILRSSFVLEKGAPDAPRRKVVLELADNTTEKDCGACKYLNADAENNCHVFGGIEGTKRSSLCIAAEK